MKNKRKPHIVLISDVHLGAIGANASALLDYLKTVKPDILIINGDFIDGWNFKKKYFPTAHFEVIRRVIKMLNQGTRVYYIAGNHDEFMRQYIGVKLGKFSVHNQLELDVDGKKMWFFHGDIFDASIQGRMKLIAKLGGKAYDLLIWCNRQVNVWLQLLGQEKMSFSKRIKNSVKLAVKWVQDFETVAADVAIKKGIDVVACGHIHTPQQRIISTTEGQVLYINSGDWIENNSAMEYQDGEWKLVQHTAYYPSAQISETEISAEVEMDSLLALFLSKKTI